MRSISAAILLCALLISGCGRSPDTRPWPDTDVPEPDHSHFDHNGAKRLENTEFGVVIANEREALAKLERSVWVELLPQEAEELLGHALGGAGGRLVLLRAIGVTERRSGFTVTWREKAVRVNHIDHVIGTPKPFVRRAIVARLPDVPSRVRIDLSIADWRSPPLNAKRVLG